MATLSARQLGFILARSRTSTSSSSIRLRSYSTQFEATGPEENGYRNETTSNDVAESGRLGTFFFRGIGFSRIFNYKFSLENCLKFRSSLNQGKCFFVSLRPISRSKRVSLQQLKCRIVYLSIKFGKFEKVRKSCLC